MASASLEIFCTQDELVDWIRALCKKKDLGWLNFRRFKPYGMVGSNADAFRIYKDTYSVFLFPLDNMPSTELDMNDVEPRTWGWVDITPGIIVKKKGTQVLTASEFHAEDSESYQFQSTKCIQWLKRYLKGKKKAGVKGKNIISGGESKYHDVNYTDAAVKMMESGVAWGQYPYDRSFFEPLK